MLENSGHFNSSLHNLLLTMEAQDVHRMGFTFGLSSEYKPLLFLLAFFPCFEKIKVGLWDHLAVCVSVYAPVLTFECRNQSLWNLVRISWHQNLSQRRN
jgi:hypothetical protein